MTKYEQIIDDYENHNINLYEQPSENFPNDVSALYYEDKDCRFVVYNCDIDDVAEKNCILAEELGHYRTSSGDLLFNELQINVMKQEETARRWADEYLISPHEIADAINKGCMCVEDLVDHFCISHEYLHQAIDRYICRYGIYFEIDVTTMLCFKPLGLLKLI